MTRQALIGRNGGARQNAPGGWRSGLDFDEDAFERRITWILGSPRSGSTWLLRLLVYPLTITRTPAGFEAPLGFDWRRDPILPSNEPYLPVHLTPLMGTYYEPGTRPDPAAFLHNTERASDPHYFFSDEYADLWRPAIRGLGLARLRAQVERGVRPAHADQVMLAVKEPNGSHGAELLMELFPSSRLLFLIRDGREVVRSMLAAYSPGGWLEGEGRKLGLDEEEQRLGFVRTHSMRWVIRMEAVERAFNCHPQALRFELRYEELLEKPRATLRRVFNWLGVQRSQQDLTDALESSGRNQTPARPGRWREAMTPREQELMTAIMDYKLDELGYATA